MLLLTVLFWCVVSLTALFVFLTIIPLRYNISGVWQDTLQCKIWVQYGPLLGRYIYDSEQRHDITLSFIGLRFGEINGQRDGLKDKGPVNKKTKAKKEKTGMAICDVRNILEKEFLTALFKTINAIYRHSRPKVWNINGVVGFDDPYYTGLFAGLRQLLHGINVEPDFSHEVYNLNMHIHGRIVILALIYYVLGFLVSREARPVLIMAWKSRKTKKARSEKAAFSS